MSKRADGSYSPAWRRVSKIILWPLIQVGMKHDWHGQQQHQEHPRDQGIILAINHLSYADIIADSLSPTRRADPVSLAKSSRPRHRGPRSVIRKLGQLPSPRPGERGARAQGRRAGHQERRLCDLLPGGDGDP